jgi:hypothetical protein
MAKSLLIGDGTKIRPGTTIDSHQTWMVIQGDSVIKEFLAVNATAAWRQMKLYGYQGRLVLEITEGE